MRAITMTTLAAILALLPLALGQGSAMLQPLAIAIIAGLIAQLPLVLIILPGAAAAAACPPGEGVYRKNESPQGVGRFAHRLSKLQLTSWTTSPVFSTSRIVPTPRA